MPTHAVAFAFQMAGPSSVTHDGAFQLVARWQRWVQEFPLRFYLHLINASHSCDMTRKEFLGSTSRLSCGNWSWVFFLKHTELSCNFGPSMIYCYMLGQHRRKVQEKLSYTKCFFTGIFLRCKEGIGSGMRRCCRIHSLLPPFCLRFLPLPAQFCPRTPSLCPPLAPTSWFTRFGRCDGVW